MKSVCAALLLAASALCCLAAERDVVAQTNTTIRIMASNLNGDPQTIEPFEIRIFQGLKPDIVAIQEFRYLNNTAADFRSLLDTAFGTNFVYFRETGYNIPNGVISRYPIRNAGSWDDTLIGDRGFAWAQIDVPGPDDLYVVSVHLKASSGTTEANTRASEATAIKNLVAANFPANAWVIVAGDFNLQTTNEAALTTFKSFLSHASVPTDAETGGNPNTNEPRSKPYDYVLPSYTFQTNLVPLVIGTRSFPNGLVFDSRVYTPLSAVAPVQLADSGNGQHMGVFKDFRISYSVTNRVTVPEPLLVLSRTNSLSWQSVSGITYTVEATADFNLWSTTAVTTATSSKVLVTNVISTNGTRFYRVAF
jgi:endonuclease/exonuclease/phosphatase family metal-dependent hydrolase